MRTRHFEEILLTFSRRSRIAESNSPGVISSFGAILDKILSVIDTLAFRYLLHLWRSMSVSAANCPKVAD